MRFRVHAAVALAASLVIGGGSAVALSEPETSSDTIAAGRLLQDRCCYSVTALPDGRVLLVGGNDVGGGSYERLATAEIWDPQSLGFQPAGEMAQARSGHTAVLQPDGRVLIIGGSGPLGRTEDAELWEPTTASFSPAPPMRHPRGHSATVVAFPDGRALVVSGTRRDTDDPGLVLEAEVWEPATQAFEEAGSLPRRPNRIEGFALDDGSALLVQGPDREWLRWDPDRRAFDAVGRPDDPRDWVFPLAGGRVLTTGVQRDRDEADAELWLPNQGRFRPAGSFVRPRNTESVTMLPDGGALFYGGYDALAKDATLFRTAEYWDPRSRSFSLAGRTDLGREWHTATPLPDGRVAFIGGLLQRRPDLDSSVTGLIELWDPTSRSFSQHGSLAEPRMLHTTVLLPDGSLLILGGDDIDGELVPTAELWTPPPPSTG
jgi:hypothetical protein